MIEEEDEVPRASRKVPQGAPPETTERLTPGCEPDCSVILGG